MPPTLAGAVGVVPALAGSAAALAGLMQQLMGAGRLQRGVGAAPGFAQTGPVDAGVHAVCPCCAPSAAAPAVLICTDRAYQPLFQ
jgi:hypothetical protein